MGNNNTIQDPSAKRLGTLLQKPITDMSIDELIEKLRGYTFRGGIGTGSITPENLDDSIIVREALIKAVNDEIERQEALDPDTDKKIEDRNKEVKRLKDIRDGKRSAVSIPTPLGVGGEEGGVRVPILPRRDYPTLADQQKAAKEEQSTVTAKATERTNLEAILPAIAKFRPEFSLEKVEVRGPQGRKELEALQSVANSMNEGKTPTKTGIRWIDNFLASPSGKATLEQVSGADVEPDPSALRLGPQAAPPDAKAEAAPTADVPPRPLTADEEAFLEAAGPAPGVAAEVPPATGEPPAVPPTDAAETPIPAPTPATTTPAAAPPTQPIPFGPGQFAAATGEDRRLDYVAPTRTTIEDYWQQAAIEWWQDTFTGRGKIGSDPSRVTQPMVDTFKAMVTDVATQQGYQNELIGVNGMAFLETYFIQAPTEPRPEDQELPPGWEDAMARVAPKRDGRDNDNYLNFNEDIRTNLDEYSPDDMTKRYSTEDKPTEDSIYFKLKRESGVAVGQGGAFRDDWFKTEAKLLYSLHEIAIQDGTRSDVEDLWDLVEGSIEDEEEPGGRLTQESYDSHVRIAKGPVTSSQVVSMLRESLLEKEPQLAELLSSAEGLLWLERQADVIKTKASKVATEHQTWDPTLGVHIPAHAQADAEVANLIAIETNKSVEDLQTEMAMTEKKMLGEWVDGSDRSIAHKSLLRTDTALGDLKNAYWGSTIADEKNLTFEQWLRDDSGEAKTASDKFVRNQQEVIMGFNEKDALNKWFFEKLVEEGKWKYEGATKEEQARMNEHFQEFERQVGNAMMQEDAFISDVVTSVGKTYIPTILTETDFKTQEAEKKRIVEAPFKARMAPEEALADATARLDERVGGPTLDQDIRDDTASLQDKIDEIADFEGDSSPYFVNGVGITQEEFDSKYTNATPEELGNFGVQTRDERAAGLDGDQEKLSDNLLQKQGQKGERDNDRDMAKLLRDHPELSKVFASGSQKALEGAAASLGKDTVPDSLADHLVKSQERQGLVLTEDQKKFRMAWGLPLPSDTFRTPEQIAEQEREREIGKAGWAARTKRYTAEGEEIKFDPTRATYDVRAGVHYDAEGNVVAPNQEDGVMIPGTNLADTDANRAALKQGIGGPGPRQGEGFEYDDSGNVLLDAQGNPVPVVAPPLPETYQPPPLTLGYYPEDEEESRGKTTTNGRTR